MFFSHEITTDIVFIIYQPELVTSTIMKKNSKIYYVIRLILINLINHFKIFSIKTFFEFLAISKTYCGWCFSYYATNWKTFKEISNNKKKKDLYEAKRDNLVWLLCFPMLEQFYLLKGKHKNNSDWEEKKFLSFYKMSKQSLSTLITKNKSDFILFTLVWSFSFQGKGKQTTCTGLNCIFKMKILFFFFFFPLLTILYVFYNFEYKKQATYPSTLKDFYLFKKIIII